MNVVSACPLFQRSSCLILLIHRIMTATARTSPLFLLNVEPRELVGVASPLFAPVVPILAPMAATPRMILATPTVKSSQMKTTSTRDILAAGTARIVLGKKGLMGALPAEMMTKMTRSLTDHSRLPLVSFRLMRNGSKPSPILSSVLPISMRRFSDTSNRAARKHGAV